MSPVPDAPRGPLHLGLWVAQLLLAAIFGAAGAFKTFTPIPELVEAGMGWASDLPAVARFAGVSELLAAVGLILPSALRIQPKLTAAAGAGLVVVMALALALHGARGELASLPVNVALGALAAFVAWGRSRRAPIPPR